MRTAIVPSVNTPIFLNPWEIGVLGTQIGIRASKRTLKRLSNVGSGCFMGGGDGDDSHFNIKGDRMINKTGVVHGRLTKGLLEELLIDTQSRETRKWLLDLLHSAPDRLGYVISYPVCPYGVPVEKRAYAAGTCSDCKEYKADNFPPGTGECKWCGW